mgnify:CR=1 FL=1
MESEEQVPILQPDEKLFKRLNILIEHFQSTYNVKPSFFVRVPGRYIFLKFVIYKLIVKSVTTSEQLNNDETKIFYCCFNR